MTTILEKALTFLAPHDCIFCGIEGNVVCSPCSQDLVDENVHCCHVCGLPSIMSQACVGCQRKTSLDALFTLGFHASDLRRLVSQLKFNYVRQTATDIAPVLSALLPVLPKGSLATHVPTSYVRARQRGFDQAEILAAAIGHELGIDRQRLLRRHGHARQVGASRQARLEQAATMFSFVGSASIKDQTVILIDDVVTTGASMEAAAGLLRTAGASRIYGLAIARGKKVGLR